MSTPEHTPRSEPSSLRSAELRRDLKQKIPELLQLERLIRHYPHHLLARNELSLRHGQFEFPLYSISLGNTDANAPTLLLTGGMHGIERIGSQVLIAWLQTLLERLNWDAGLQYQLAHTQLILMPILNPVGMYLNTRSNGNGVDLNRNAPVNAEGKVPLLGGGHRLGKFLPWYRGRKNAAMEPENIALENIMHTRILNRPFALAVDLHSGFGMRDQLWFPYAYRKKPIQNIAEYVALKMLWERTYPNHTYVFEPQAVHYLSHGDLWDYFYLQSHKKKQEHFLPLTLELGSWAWIKKRPRQIFNMAGLFNPQMQHRHARVLRSHLLLLDFMLAATRNYQHWLPDEKQTGLLKQTANSLWFTNRN
ncbi:MAG TPA: DUF2817 domain-containing protein [Cellvibrio sp.]|nr:DUF2817 domain-containing protein [Cellvibrio sp.]